MSLYQKHRPKDLDGISGNKALVSSLKTLLERKSELPHVFLFTGGSGCGKTTVGRILAKEIGCSGSDLNEVDSADFRGIDSIRNIRKQMRMSPLNGSCRVWLLDECHKLTNDAQNALLKALEDTPSHVYFILCTTDPQKLLKTIRTRCVPYEVDSLNDKTIGRLLKNVARKEGVGLPTKVKSQIARDSLGSPRQALVLLEKILHLPEDEMLEAAKLSAEEESEVIELCRILMSSNNTWASISHVVQGINQDPETVRRAILGYCSSVLLNSKAGNQRAGMVIECFLDNFYDSGKAGLVLSCWQCL